MTRAGKRRGRNRGQTRKPRRDRRGKLLAIDHGDVVLLVSDDAEIRRSLYESLADSGCHPVLGDHSIELHELATRLRPLVILLDLDGAGDGVTALARVRESSRTPVIVMSERTAEGDKVAALDAGADDYIAKPFGTSELLARIRVALRYARKCSSDDGPIELGPIQLDGARHRVAIAGRAVHLTPIEFRLLAVLARHRGALVPRVQLAHEIWGPATDQADHLRVHMAALRKKIEPDPAHPRLIITITGLGYRLAVD